MKQNEQAEWMPRALRESALQKLDQQLAAESDSIDLKFQRASLLAELGRTSEARDAYIELLARDPAHRGALNNLGTLLHETGYRTAARTAYTQAVLKHPNDPMSLVNLANVLREDNELTEARKHYERAVRIEPEHAEAHRGLAYVLMEIGDEEGVALHRNKGFQNHAMMTLPYRGAQSPVLLLQLLSTTGGNIPTRNFLDDRVFQTTVMFPEFYDSRLGLPSHHVIFNAIGDADLSPGALIQAQRMLEGATARVINPPATVLASGREANARRLSALSGVVVPRIATLSRNSLLADNAAMTLSRLGFKFPLLLRTPGFHTGRHFVRLESSEDLPAALAELPGKELLAVEYLDARGPDGKARKYRVMMIAGNLYPLHLAIADSWKVHYFTAEMANHAERRAEEARFLEDMAGVLGTRAMNALGQIKAVLTLDYGGIDFSLNANGEILFFEANATMVVNPPEADERWAYRRSAVERIYEAVRNMLMNPARAMT